MTIPNETNISRWTGNGTTADYDFAYKILAKEDLEVEVLEVATGETTPLVLEDDFTVPDADVGAASGTITLVDDSQDWIDDDGFLDDGWIITIRRNPAVTQETDIRNEGAGYKATLEDAFDHATMVAQARKNDADRALKVPASEDPDDYTLEIPSEILRAGKVLSFDDDGNLVLIANVPDSGMTVTAIGEALLESATEQAAREAIGFDGAGGTVQTADIEDDAITGDKIPAEAITADHLNSDAVSQVFQARVTAQTNEPFYHPSHTSSTNVYLTPAVGNKIALYNGSRWKLHTHTQISLAIPAVANQMYDLFVHDNAGTLTLSAVAWTNDTTRATALARQDGVYVKTAAATHRYCGSFRTKTSGQVSDDARYRHVWNYYNRITKACVHAVSPGSEAYTTNTWRQVAADATYQVDFVQGVAEEYALLEARGLTTNTNANIVRGIGIGRNSTTAPISEAFGAGGATSVSEVGEFIQHRLTVMELALGRNYYPILQKSIATGTTAWYTTDDMSNVSTAIQTLVRC